MPAAQPEHSALPSSTVVLPAAHADGATLPVLHELPAGHGVHSSAAVRLVAFENEPASHGSAAAAPDGQYEPASHESHVCCAVADWYVPPSHGTHTPCPPEGCTVPAAHSVCAVDPVVHR